MSARIAALKELWKRGTLVYKLDQNQKTLYHQYYTSKEKRFVWLLSRRCLAKGSLIKTPKGLVAIEDLKIGDQVFGVNSDGSVSISNVIETWDNGEKEVVELKSSARILEECTDDHTWLTVNCHTSFKQVERQTKDITKSYHRIVKKQLDHSLLTGVNEPHAYAIGALLGDGCSKQGNGALHISSEDSAIPKKVAEILGVGHAIRNSENNYTWIISSHIGLGKGNPYAKVHCNYYDEWCRDRYAHEKFTDLNVVKSWNVDSQLRFLAGILDTDGSFTVTKDNCLVISLGMQSKSTVEACQYIIHNLFEHKTTLLIDNRKKYKNGPVYNIKIKNNAVCKRILKALSPHTVCDRKKWKDEYESFNENNTAPDYVGIKKGNRRLARTYDISIDNQTNLYLTANGLVTHNCGKSYLLCILALEQCLKEPNTIVKYVAQTKMQCKSIILPIFKQILEDCPDELKPDFSGKDFIFTFKNGSEIQLAGTDNGHAEKLRGGSSWLNILDEAGSCNDLKNIVTSVLTPTTLTTNGKTILASTPPEDYDHEFNAYVEDAEVKGTLTIKTIEDNTRLSKEQIAEAIEEMGGRNAVECRREYFCERIKSENNSVLPEATQDLMKEIVREHPKPAYYDSYVSMDLGLNDLTVVLFAYYDFRSGKLIIEDEIVKDYKSLHLSKLGEEIWQKEGQLWTNIMINERITPYSRVSDTNLVATNEIMKSTNNKVVFQSAKKDDLKAAVNNLRVLLDNKNIYIDPKCKTLIRHLVNARWAKAGGRNQFNRSADGGHNDALAALIYLTRAVNFQKNPYPHGYNLPPGDYFYPKKSSPYESNQLDVYKRIFGKKK